MRVSHAGRQPEHGWCVHSVSDRSNCRQISSSDSASSCSICSCSNRAAYSSVHAAFAPTSASRSMLCSETSSVVALAYVPPSTSGSGTIPQANTKFASEWKCANNAMACTSSPSDQLSLPRSRVWPAMAPRRARPKQCGRRRRANSDGAQRPTLAYLDVGRRQAPRLVRKECVELGERAQFRWRSAVAGQPGRIAAAVEEQHSLCRDQIDAAVPTGRLCDARPSGAARHARRHDAAAHHDGHVVAPGPRQRAVAVHEEVMRAQTGT